MYFWHIKTFENLTTEDLYDIMKIRQEVFVVEQECAYADADGKDLEALHFWADAGGEIVAYCRIFPPGVQYTEASIGRVLTKLTHRRTAIGRRLMYLALQIVEAKFRSTSVTISAQDYLLKFYGEFGFQTTEKSYLEDGIPHTEMRRN